MSEVPSLNPAAELGQFFDFIWQDAEGYVYLPTKHPETEEWTPAYFAWPRERDQVIRHVRSSTGEREVYYSPAIYNQPSGQKEHVKGAYVNWVDFDGNYDPAKMTDVPAPSMRIRSSESGHEHVYWKLSYFEVDVPSLEKANRSLAYKLDADTSGWDANQVLRPPTTTNHKRGKSVLLLARSDTEYGPGIFSDLPSPVQHVKENLELSDIPDALDVVAKYQWSSEAFEFFRTRDIPTGARSSALMRMGFYCAELRMSDEEAFAILDNADQRWGKFKKRTDRVKRLLEIINRARQKYPLNPSGEVLDEFPVFGFDDFINTELSVEWIIPGILQRAGLALLTGPPGTGKTQLSLQFAIHMALGKPFLGWDLNNPTRVMFVSMEMGHADLKWFIDQMAEGLSDEERVTLQENLLVVPLGFGVLLDTPADQSKINRLVEKYNPGGLVFDSLGTTTLDELSSEGTVKQIFDYINRLRAEHDLFVWFIHHNRKAQATNKKPNKLADVYGSQYIGAQCTTVIGLWPVAETIEVSALKVRLSRPFDQFAIRRVDHLNFELSKVGAGLLKSMQEEEEEGKNGSGANLDL